jgi:hypothetical protein
MKTTLSILLLICIASVATATGKPKQITKISHRQFNIPKEIVAFVSHLVESDPDVSTQYEKLTAATREEAGGKFAVGDFVAIEWLVPEFSVEFGESGGTRDGEYIYLVQQQLRSGFHRGYSVDDNVVARVHVKLHEDHKPNPKKKDDFVLSSNSLELTFEGFVAVTLTPE